MPPVPSHRPALRRWTAPLLLGLALGPLASPGVAAQVAPQSFQGHLARDNALALFQFTLALPGDLSAHTLSHSGGLNAAGASVPEGGFAPVLSLFDAAGELLAMNAGSSNACTAPGSFCWDATLQLRGLGAGSYLLVLSQDDNLPLGTPIALDDPAPGFSRHLEPHYTAAYLGMPTDGSLNFVRIDGSPRTGQWALELQVDAVVSQVPEPPAVLLLALGVAALASRRTLSRA